MLLRFLHTQVIAARLFERKKQHYTQQNMSTWVYRPSKENVHASEIVSVTAKSVYNDLNTKYVSGKDLLSNDSIMGLNSIFFLYFYNNKFVSRFMLLIAKQYIINWNVKTVKNLREIH